jgi:hypothetical protein
MTTDTAQQAPRTIRLSQNMANQLREAWIEARRSGDVLLSYQDFADDIIDQGLTADSRRR